MVTSAEIQHLSDEIAAAYRPKRIILFGSYAYGSPTPDSDVDLLVVMRHNGRSHCVLRQNASGEPDFEPGSA